MAEFPYFGVQARADLVVDQTGDETDAIQQLQHDGHRQESSPPRLDTDEDHVLLSTLSSMAGVTPGLYQVLAK